MVRHLIEREIKKRLAIRIRRQNNPGISMRALAKEFRTSLRVVYDAMTRSIAGWNELLDESIPRQIISEKMQGIELAHRQSIAAQKSRMFNEPDLDPDLDPDPDPNLFVD